MSDSVQFITLCYNIKEKISKVSFRSQNPQLNPLKNFINSYLKGESSFMCSEIVVLRIQR